MNFCIERKMKSRLQRSILQLVSSLFILTLFVHGQDNVVPDDQEPYFIEEPYDITIKENSRTVLPCRVAGLTRKIVDGGGGHVQWTRGGFGLGTGRQLDDWPHFRMIGQNLESKNTFY